MKVKLLANVHHKHLYLISKFLSRECLNYSLHKITLFSSEFHLKYFLLFTFMITIHNVGHNFPVDGFWITIATHTFHTHSNIYIRILLFGIYQKV